jgi:hypothetical protein
MLSGKMVFKNSHVEYYVIISDNNNPKMNP